MVVKKACVFNAHENNDVPEGHDEHHDVPDEKYVYVSNSFSRAKNKDSLIWVQPVNTLLTNHLPETVSLCTKLFGLLVCCFNEINKAT